MSESSSDAREGQEEGNEGLCPKYEYVSKSSLFLNLNKFI